MAHSSGFYNKLIQVLNRKAATLGKFGVDASGIEWEDGDILHANVSFAKGKQAMNAGALDVYCVEELQSSKDFTGLDLGYMNHGYSHNRMHGLHYGSSYLTFKSKI